MSISPKDRAERSLAAMWAKDVASTWAGMEVLSVDEGFAELRLVVARNHTNGHDICHGGVIFMLADSAFAFACNSRNQVTVAQSATITFLAPGRLGDVLIATAREVAVQGRSGVYDVGVINQDCAPIAQFRGLSWRMRGSNFDE